MGTVNVTLGEDTRLNLILGQQDENEVREVVFDFSGWYTTYGSGTISLSVQRSKDQWPYEVELTVDNTNHTATWTITDTDTGYAGVGMIQITYTVGTAKKKSVVYRFTVYKSLGATGNVITPVQLQTWMDEVDQDIADIKQDLQELIDHGTDGGMSARAKLALINCFKGVWWMSEESDDLIAELISSLYSNYVAVTGMTLNTHTLTVERGSSQQITATVTPNNATVKSINWTSSNTAIATVDEQGNVTGVSVGSVTIQAKTADGGYIDTCSVTVQQAVINYTITNNLTNAINSNTATSITENSSYSGTITATEGNRITSAVITMGGTDVTSDVYSNGEISIGAVTGDVVITVIAEEIGNIFENVAINTGYMVNASTGAVSASSNKFATDMADVSEYAGQVIYVECLDGTPSTGSTYEYRLVFYDSSEAFISSIYCNPTTLSQLIPSNAKYMRVGGLWSTLTGINAYVAKNAIESMTEGGYYNVQDGVIAPSTSYAHTLVPVVAGKFYIKNVFSAVFFDENQEYVRGRGNMSGSANVDIYSGESYIGANSTTANIDSIEIYTATDYQIGTVSI